MQSTPTPTPWYNKPVLVNILLFLFFPVGLFGLWKSKKIATWWKIGGTLIIMALIINVISQPDDKAPAAAVAPAPPRTAADEKADREAEAKAIADNTVTAPQLVSLYAENEVKADQMYKDKTLYVKGTVGDIKKDMLDQVYVALEGDGVLSRVQCFLDDEKAAANLSKGQQVLIKGKCDGLMMNVLMKDCELVQ